MNGVRVALWTQTPAGKQILRYDRAWEASPLKRSLALSLPILPDCPDVTGAPVANYFTNLLPANEQMRERMRRRCGAPAASARHLLAAFGADCRGAVRLLADGVSPALPDHSDGQVLDSRQIEQLLAEAGGDAPEGSSLLGDLRVCLTGSHPKVALLKVGHQWHLPHAGTPTTHIFKLPGEALALENEWLCLAILRALGLPAAQAHLLRFRTQQALVVERFDRRWSEGRQTHIGLPMESVQQAIGKGTTVRSERAVRPGLKAGIWLLAAGSRVNGDSQRLLLGDMALWLLASPDTTARRFSIFLERCQGFRLTPMCGVVSRWTQREGLDEPGAIDWKEIARKCGLPHAFDLMETMIRQLPQALAEVETTLPRNFPHQVFDTIRNGMLARARTVVANI